MPYELNFMVHVYVDKIELNQPLFSDSFVLSSIVPDCLAQIRLHKADLNRTNTDHLLQMILKLRLTGFHTYFHFVNVMNIVIVRATNPGFNASTLSPMVMYDTQHVLHLWIFSGV